MEPSFPEKAKNLTGDLVNHAKNGFLYVSTEIFNDRMAKCENCEYFKNSKCTVCGCYMKYKAKWEISRCPKGFW